MLEARRSTLETLRNSNNLCYQCLAVFDLILSETFSAIHTEFYVFLELNLMSLYNSIKDASCWPAGKLHRIFLLELCSNSSELLLHCSSAS